MVGFNSIHHLHIHKSLLLIHSNQSIYQNLLNLSFATVGIFPALLLVHMPTDVTNIDVSEEDDAHWEESVNTGDEVCVHTR